MPRKETSEQNLKRSKKMKSLIQNTRKSMKMTQEELAEKAHISIDTLRSIENQKIKTPNIFIFLDLAKILNLKWKEIRKL